MVVPPVTRVLINLKCSLSKLLPRPKRPNLDSPKATLECPRLVASQRPVAAPGLVVDEDHWAFKRTLERPAGRDEARFDC